MSDPRKSKGTVIVETTPGYMKPGKHYQVNIDNSAAGNDLPTLIGAALDTIFTNPKRLPSGVFIFPENGDLRFRDDTVDPSNAAIGAAGVGYPIPSKTEYLYTGDLDVIKLIAAGAAAVLTSLYFVY